MKGTKVKKFLPLLKIINKLKKEDQTSLLNFLDDSSHECLYSCMYNALKNPRLPAAGRRKLRKGWKGKENDIRYVVNESKPIRLRKKRFHKLQRGGGVITLLLSTLVPILTSLFSK